MKMLKLDKSTQTVPSTIDVFRLQFRRSMETSTTTTFWSKIEALKTASVEASLTHAIIPYIIILAAGLATTIVLFYLLCFCMARCCTRGQLENYLVTELLHEADANDHDFK